MSRPSVQTFEDIRRLVSLEIPESTALEYKSIKVVDNNDTGTIAKAVSAFANSIGGTLVFGVECTKGVPRSLVGSQLGSKLDWLYKVIFAHTHPPVESISCFELNDGGAIYYLVQVERSHSAPHQASDGRYYRRRGPHGEVLEHYEIEDIRTRPKSPMSPLRVELVADDQVAFLKVQNSMSEGVISDVKMDIDTNIELERDGIEHLSTRGLKRLYSGQTMYFLLDAFPMMFEKAAEPTITVRTEYEFNGAVIKDEQTFHLADRLHSIIMRSAGDRASDKLERRLESLQRTLDRIASSLDGLSHVSDGTGLRLSKRTIDQIRLGEIGKLSPLEFGREGYRILLSISNKDAQMLSSIFHAIGGSEQRKKRYEALPPALRAKFETLFDPEM